MFNKIIDFWFNELEPKQWWQKDDGLDAQIKTRFGELHHQASVSELFVEDGSFVKLRELTLSYSFPTKLISKWKLSSLSLSATGRNLFTITDYSGVDPEVNTFGAGISGAGSMSIDNLGTPNMKGFDLGLKVRF